MTTKKRKPTKNLPHDSLFKRIMENDIAAREFLDEYLPVEVKNIVDLNTIKVQKESYIEPNLTKRLSDIVYSVNTKDNEKAFIYIAAERQSSVDNLMAFRLWKYMLLLAEKHLKDKGKLPLIFPIVVYAGKAKYTAPRNLWALFEYPELAKKLMTEDHALLDLQAMSDEDIAKKKHIALFEYVMKHAHMRDMLKLWENIFNKLPHAVIIDKEYGYFYISNLLWYIDRKLPEDKRDELSSLIIEYLPKSDGEEIMRTVADSYIDEGIQIGISQGIEQGIEQSAIRMLKQNLDPKLIASITGFSQEELLKLKQKI